MAAGQTRGNQQLTWIHAIGGDFRDRIEATATTPDGGFLLVGQSKSFQVVSPVDYDIWVLKVDQFGFIVWEYTLGEDGPGETGWDAVPTAEGGCVLLGLGLRPGDTDSDAWILKLNPTGTLAWQKSYGGLENEVAYALCTGHGGGYVAAGSSASLAASTAGWLVRVGDDGSSLWQGAYGGTASEGFNDVAAANDGGYIAVGSTDTNTGSSKAWVVKVDGGGALVWQKELSGQSGLAARKVLAATDGGFYISGGGCLVKLDATGDLVWQRRTGATGLGLVEDGDGNIYHSATFYLDQVDFAGYRWAKMNASGDFIEGKAYWAQTTLDEWNRDLLPTDDGGFLLSGWTNDPNMGAGFDDAFLLKLDGSGSADAYIPARIIDFNGPFQASDLSIADSFVTAALGNVTPADLALDPVAVQSTVTIHGGNPLIPSWIQWPSLTVVDLANLVNQFGL